MPSHKVWIWIYVQQMIRTRLTNKIFIAATILASLFTLFFGVYEYNREHAFRVDILHAQLQLNNYKQALSPTLPLEAEGVDSTYRITIIDTKGNVIYDSHEKNVKKMGNHLLREEIQEALHYGSGYAIKRATSLLSGGERGAGEKYFYSATYFKGPSFGSKLSPLGEAGEGFIVRSAVPYSAELTASLEHDYTFLYYTASILSLIATAFYFRHRYEHSEREKQRIKRQLTENAAHELKTPAATIEGYLETLVSNPDLSEEKRMNFLQRCHAQSRRMSQLLADMNTLSRLDEAQEMVKHKLSNNKQLDAAIVLRQIQEETAMQFRQQHIQLQLQIPETLPMQGDASLIYSLFRNIFNNTLAYATEATYFRVQAKVLGERLTFSFIDNGVGVPAEHLPHLFERFYRIDKGRSRRLGGTGLGLAIVKNIALQYGGSASALHTPGGGLTIEIELTNHPSSAS